MTAKKMNDAPIVDQLDGHWEKMFAYLLWKLAGRKQIRITVKDMEECARAFKSGGPIIYTHGHADAVDFQLVDEAAAKRIAEHDAAMRGTA